MSAPCAPSRYPVVGQIFTYTFIALFIYVVLNVFIAIIEESFFTVVQRGKEMVEEMRCVPRLHPVANTGRGCMRSCMGDGVGRRLAGRVFVPVVAVAQRALDSRGFVCRRCVFVLCSRAEEALERAGDRAAGSGSDDDASGSSDDDGVGSTREGSVAKEEVEEGDRRARLVRHLSKLATPAELGA